MDLKKIVEFPVSYGQFYFINPIKFLAYSLFYHESGVLTDQGWKQFFGWFYGRWYECPSDRIVTLSCFRFLGFTKVDIIWLCKTEEEVIKWKTEMLNKMLESLKSE